MVKARWGKAAHFVFTYYAFATNLIVTSMLILGGADCMAATSGMNVYLASFLIPITVLTYTVMGGLKATFLASYIHTAIIFVGLVLFVTWTYVINDCPETPAGTIPVEQCNSIGSASAMYERLAFIAALDPSGKQGGSTLVEGGFKTLAAGGSFNRGGSYLTMLSLGPRVRHHQHRGQLRHRLRRPVLLAVGHRGLARLGAQGLPPRRPHLVHHPLLARHLARPCRQRAQRQAY